MMILKRVAQSMIVTSLILSASSLLAARLTVPESFDVLKVNGNSYSGGFFTLDKEIDLAPGDHTLELRYNEYFESEFNDSHAFIKSEPFLVSFTIKENQDLVLNRPPLADIDEARIYAENPRVILESSGKVVAELSTSDVPVEAPKKAHMHVAVSNADAPQPEATTSTVTAPAVQKPQPSGPDNLAMLKYWWQQASNEEKALFKDYINNN